MTLDNQSGSTAAALVGSEGKECGLGGIPKFNL